MEVSKVRLVVEHKGHTLESSTEISPELMQLILEKRELKKLMDAAFMTVAVGGIYNGYHKLQDDGKV